MMSNDKFNVVEVRNLIWEDIYLINRYVTFMATKNFSYRTIPLNQLIINTLTELKKESVSNLVFIYKGKPYQSETAWRKAWKTTLKNQEYLI